MPRPLILLFAAFMLAMPVRADSTLIELFASHNCRASDQAHATLARIHEAREDVLILTWSVDYWDYLGEDDPMAMPEGQARQAAYVDKFGLRGAYTPQTVYDGALQCPGNRERDVTRAISRARARPATGIAVAIGERSAQVTGQQPGELILVDFLTRADLPGETGGKIHPVTGLTRLGAHEAGTSRHALPECQSGCALIVQDPDSQEVLALARVR
ncbi:MAG: DUF1223 domain-containing protein [Alphaproteobacteria bacterium]|jgi:hypothetical protein|nr:DUF1223 domain-containing protein [Alphaproteobacteria bacterium]